MFYLDFMDIFNIIPALEGYPEFRRRQAFSYVYNHLIDNWDQASQLPLDLRYKLNRQAPLGIDAEAYYSTDRRTIRAVLARDSHFYEAVLMRHGNRNTVCVSSQIGCAMGCRFCATGRLGLAGSLEAGEIVSQVLYFARLLKKQEQKVNNVVYMGMGEPLANYEEVIKSVKDLNDSNGLNIGARRISISTVGLVDGINKLAKNPLQLNLAVSLHAPNDDLRGKLMPVNQRYGISVLLSAVRNYQTETRRKVLIEYILLKQVNDRPEHAKELADRLKAGLIHGLYTVNLIGYNKTKDFSPSSREDVSRFKNLLKRTGVPVVERYKFGQNIKAACGQLAGEKALL